MHDIRWIREHPEAFDHAMKARKESVRAGDVLAIDQERREAINHIQQLQHERKNLAKEIGQVKSRGGNADDLQQKARDMNDEIARLEEASQQDALVALLETLPNIPAEDVPVGASEDDNVEVRQIGTPRVFDFAPKSHDELGVALGLLDFEQAAMISGARFSILKGELARLERALAQWMLDSHAREFGYTEVVPPFITLPSAMYGVGQLPKFEEDSYSTTDGYRLIPTAEVSLTNMVADKILAEAELPLRYTAYSPCFRREAGSAGKDTKGMMRQHQFTKVELVSITSEEESLQEHERMTGIAEGLLKRLDLPYRVVTLCTGDLGFSSHKTYDLEVWIPSQDKYREISSCSNCGAFQARRMKARYRPEGAKDTKFVHTLNGSALAIGRTMIAIMENYQQADGSIEIPSVLHPYMGGCTVIKGAVA